MALDEVSLQRLGVVCPALANIIFKLADQLASQEIVFRITQGVRSWADQAALYALGRDSNGVVVDAKKVVTNAPPGHSWHEFGLAVDFVPMVNGQPVWNSSDPIWMTIISAGKELGLVSGSDFVHLKDIPHFQLTGTFPISPTDEVRQIFQHVGMTGVWVEAGLYQIPEGSNASA